MLPLLFSTPLFSFEYLYNDFSDKQTHFRASSYLNAKSNLLTFGEMDENWDTLPEHKHNNRAFGLISHKFTFEQDGVRVGFFDEQIAQIEANSGFVHTLYSAQKNFFTFLAQEDSYETIAAVPINGKANYLISRGLSLQKVFNLNQIHFFGSTLKLHQGKSFQHFEAQGKNDSNRLLGSMDYYYSEKNYLTGREDQDASSGLGYSVDLEYIYKKNNLYLYAAVFNLYSFLYWRDITYLTYDFDSEVIYRDEEGYNNYRPFGKGKYNFNQNFKQRIPQYYKASANYELSPVFALGNIMELYDGVLYNQPYVNVRVGSFRYKIGYVIENKESVFGFYSKYLLAEISNNFGPSNNVLQAKCTIRF